MNGFRSLTTAALCSAALVAAGCGSDDDETAPTTAGADAATCSVNTEGEVAAFDGTKGTIEITDAPEKTVASFTKDVVIRGDVKKGSRVDLFFQGQVGSPGTATCVIGPDED